MGRPTLLTDLVAQQIVAAVEKGASREGAAKSARVGERTLHEWLQRGRDGEMPYASLVDRVREAEGKLEVVAATVQLKLAVGSDHAPTQLKAAEGILARLRREQPSSRGATNDGPRDAAADLDVARSVVAALESRRVA